MDWSDAGLAGWRVEQAVSESDSKGSLVGQWVIQ